MPTSVWEAELSFDGFAYPGRPDPGADPFRVDHWWIGLEAVCLPLFDPLPQFNPAPDDGNFAIFTGYADMGEFDFSLPPVTGAFQIVTMRLGDAEQMPPQWQQPFIISVIQGGSPATLAAGGTLSITKDYGSDLMTFTGPLGTQTCSLTGIDALPGGPYGYHNTTPLRPRGYAHRLSLTAPSPASPAVDVDDTVRWYNLVGKENGTPYLSVALSAGDPGTWWPINSRAFVPGVGTTDPGLAPWWTFSQLTSRQKVEAVVLATSYPSWDAFITWKRLMTPMPVTGLDVAVMDEHAILFRGWPLPPGDTDLQVSRSHDFGHSWTDYTAVADGHLKGSVSVAVFAGQVYCVYYDTTAAAVKQVSSLDLGNVWSSPMPVGITGTNPRLVIAADGPFFYFYMSGGNLVLQRSFDLGASLFDGTPIVVAAGVPAQDFAAVMATDRSLSVAYSNGGVWFTRRSLDYGNTWFDA